MVLILVIQSVRGALTEGRFLVFESNGHALSFDAEQKALSVAPTVGSHDSPSQRFILHATAPPPATTFTIQPADTPSTGFISSNHQLTTSMNDAAVFNITDLGFGRGYTVQQVSSNGNFVSFSEGNAAVQLGEQQQTFSVFSVTKSTDSGQGFLN